MEKCRYCGVDLTPKTVNGFWKSFKDKDIGDHIACLKCRKEGVTYY